MFEPFPGNYVWNLSTNLALYTGGSIGEIDDACRLLREAGAAGGDSGTEAFFEAWNGLGDRLVKLAQDDQTKGRMISAGEKYGRASIYYQTAERMQSRHFPRRMECYLRVLDTFEKFIRLARKNCQRVSVPYKDTTLQALFIPAATKGPAPCMVHMDGLDITKELLYRTGIADEFARRGVSTLIIDHPGVGEALRKQGLSAFPKSEVWAGAAVDYLMTRSDVDAQRTGVIGLSLGGYYAPRAACFEKRFKCCVAWGANYNWGEVQIARRAEQGSRPVPHYWDHVQWVWGQNSLDDFMAFVPKVSLVGILGNMTCPILITHGENDRQIALDYARKTYDDCVNSPKRELKIHTIADGGSEHCSVDNIFLGRDYIADWVAETLGGNTC